MVFLKLRATIRYSPLSGRVKLSMAEACVSSASSLLSNNVPSGPNSSRKVSKFPTMRMEIVSPASPSNVQKSPNGFSSVSRTRAPR